MDGVISQGDNDYLNTLLNYNKILSQRNSLLKYFAVNNSYNQETLDIYNLQMHDLGTTIHEKRKAFLNEFMPIF